MNVPSQSDPSVTYEVLQIDGKWTCTCTGWSVRRHCSHIRKAIETEAAGTLVEAALARLREQGLEAIRASAVGTETDFGLAAADKLWNAIDAMEASLNSCKALIHRQQRRADRGESQAVQGEDTPTI